MFEYQKLLEKTKFKKKDSVSFGDRIEAILKSKIFNDQDKIAQILTIINSFLEKTKPNLPRPEVQRDLQDETDSWDNDLNQEVVVKTPMTEKKGTEKKPPPESNRDTSTEEKTTENKKAGENEEVVADEEVEERKEEPMEIETSEKNVDENQQEKENEKDKSKTEEKSKRNEAKPPAENKSGKEIKEPSKTPSVTKPKPEPVRRSRRIQKAAEAIKSGWLRG